METERARSTTSLSCQKTRHQGHGRYCRPPFGTWRRLSWISGRLLCRFHRFACSGMLRVAPWRSGPPLHSAPCGGAPFRSVPPRHSATLRQASTVRNGSSSTPNVQRSTPNVSRYQTPAAKSPVSLKGQGLTTANKEFPLPTPNWDATVFDQT